MLLFFLHRTIVALYLALPVAALLWALLARARGNRQALPSLILTVVAGVMLAVGVGLVYAYAVGGRPVVTQILLAAYFATGLLLLLKCFDAALNYLGRRIFRLHQPAAAGFDAIDAPERPAVSRPAPKSPALRYLAMQLMRLLILFAVGLPYVMASVMTYRPKVAPTDDPMSQLGFKYQRVEFPATDGTKLIGWWIPAPSRVVSDDDDDDPRWGRETVLICHGLAANKTNQLVMARDFPTAGYNVLIFDFRAHGESGGQLTTFGNHERRDVLGAVRYLRSERPEQSERILGVGASMGAAALVAAAADASDEGQAIDAIALYGTYDHLGALSQSVADLYFAPPMDWLLKHLAVPMASAQTGSDIKSFAPASLISELWPRPVLVIHGVDDEIIPFEHGRDLYNAATLPKSRLWLGRMSHNSIITDETAGQQVLHFFETAEDVPVI